jgi:hypothetical protein
VPVPVPGAGSSLGGGDEGAGAGWSVPVTPFEGVPLVPSAVGEPLVPVDDDEPLVPSPVPPSPVPRVLPPEHPVEATTMATIVTVAASSTRVFMARHDTRRARFPSFP